MSDYLDLAQRWAASAHNAEFNENAQRSAIVSIAHSFVVIAEQLSAPKSRVAAYDWSAIMDEVAERIGARVRACPHCNGEECSH